MNNIKLLAGGRARRGRPHVHGHEPTTARRGTFALAGAGSRPRGDRAAAAFRAHGGAFAASAGR